MTAPDPGSSHKRRPVTGYPAATVHSPLGPSSHLEDLEDSGSFREVAEGEQAPSQPWADSPWAAQAVKGSGHPSVVLSLPRACTEPTVPVILAWAQQ